ATDFGQLQRREVVFLRGAVMPGRLDRLAHLDGRGHQCGRRPLADLVQEGREMRPLRVTRREVPQLLAHALDLPLIRVQRHTVDPVTRYPVPRPQREETRPSTPPQLRVPLPALEVAERHPRGKRLLALRHGKRRDPIVTCHRALSSRSESLVYAVAGTLAEEQVERVIQTLFAAERARAPSDRRLDRTAERRP